VSAEVTVVAAVRQLSPDWAVLARWLAGLQAPVTVVLEATLYCWWLERQLTGAGYTVIVVNAYQVKLIWQTRTKTDPIDAQKLAELARVGMLPALWVPDPRTRARCRETGVDPFLWTLHPLGEEESRCHESDAGNSGCTRRSFASN